MEVEVAEVAPGCCSAGLDSELGTVFDALRVVEEADRLVEEAFRFGGRTTKTGDPGGSMFSNASGRPLLAAVAISLPRARANLADGSSVAVASAVEGDEV